MITIDGSEGEGGGQMVRNACALSLITGEAFHFKNIRAKRSKPGLMRQHLTAVEAACRISGSAFDGIQVGATDLTFRPGTVVPGEYHFSIGTAGSTSLVLQTVLMPLIFASAPSRLVIEGGTHAMGAPPFEFIERCFLPLINQMGPRISARLIRHGFYPRGGGRIEVDIEPAPLRPIACLDRGAPMDVACEAHFAGISFDVARRLRGRVQAALPTWPQTAFSVRELPPDQGPGVILMLTARYAHVAELVSGFGQLGVPAEQVGKVAAARMQGYQESIAFAGPHLADQLVLPFVLAGRGQFTTVKPTQHLITAMELATRFTGRRFDLADHDGGAHLVSVGL